MMNSVGIPQGQYVAPTKTNGKNHCRRDELTAYRETIAIANQCMIGAAIEKDNEAVSCWSKITDAAQAKIFAIIEQEDNHSYKKADMTSSGVKSAIDNADKAIDTANKAVNTAIKATGVVAGSKFSKIA